MRFGLLLVLAACGRIGFSDRGARDADVDAEDAAPDAAPDAPMFVGCGDGVCMGNGGESCTSCASDCMTTTAVCGNGVCDPGEDSASCMPDCGPTPWPFAQLETDFLTEVNIQRQAGTACPGAMSGTVVAAFSVNPSDPAPARHNAWEIAHDNNSLATTKTCSGAEMAATFVNPAGYSVAIWGWNYGSGKAAADGLVAAANTCPILMDGSRTVAMVGAATDIAAGWVIYMK